MLSATVDIWFVHLGIKLSDWSKGFKVFGYEIYFYGCVIALAVLLGLWVATRVAQKYGQDPEIYYELVIYGVIFGIIGARLYYVAFAWDNYKDNLKEILNIRGGGLAIYGGVIAAVLTALVFCKIKKLKPLLVIDTAICGLITGQCVGRWSNFFNMEAFGGYTDNLLAMRLNVEKVNSSMVPDEMEKIVSDGVTYIQVHPTFLYESLWSLGVLIILLLAWRKKKFDGEIALLYCVGYGSGRFWIEGLRTDQLLIGHTDFAVSQLLSAVLVLAAAAVLVWKFISLKKKAAAEKEAKSNG